MAVNYPAMGDRAKADRRAERIGLRCGAVGTVGLLLLGLAYSLTIEPAPRIRVEWHPNLTGQQRIALEQKYMLFSGRDVIAHGSIAYDLLDTSRANIRALIDDPAVVDTNDIDREASAIPFDTEYGLGWMWVAHRAPGLRDARVRSAVIVAFVTMAVGGFAVASFLRHRSTRRIRGSTAPRSPQFPASM